MKRGSRALFHSLFFHTFFLFTRSFMFVRFAAFAALALSTFTVSACSSGTRSAGEGTAAATAAPAPEGATPGGRRGSHGMVIFGGDHATYLSHIPMFMRPHDVQLLLEVKLEGGDAPLPKSFSAKPGYTFVPEGMSLDDVRLGRRTSFRGTLFEGNFEHGGTELVHGITASVEAIRFDQLLDSRAVDPETPDYLLIGEATDTTLVRIIHAKRTSIDELSPFTFAPETDTESLPLAEGVRVTAADSNAASDGSVSLVLPGGTSVVGQKLPALSCLTAPNFEDACPR